MHFFPPKTDVGALGRLHSMPGMFQCNQALLQASQNNTDIIYVGDENNQPFELPPGAGISFGADDPAKIYVSSPTAGQRLNWGIE